MPDFDVDSSKTKIVRDPVYGYIHIGSELFDNIIDTPQFQRLRRIEQGNLSVLYPAATHTRFEHSLGVFHLGSKIFDAICNNFQDVGYKDTFREKYRNTVLLACLLHDIGHAPLAHLGEDFFPEHADILNAFSAIIGTDHTYFTHDKPAKHELMSALVAIKVYGETLSKYRNFETELFCRLITGIEYGIGTDEEEKDIKNSLIYILNSFIDVDKIDYIMRDTLSAGLQSLNLDIERIISSAMIVRNGEGTFFAFKKSGLSVVNSIVNNRNYMFFWMYGHHKVQYHGEIVTRYLAKIRSIYEDKFKKLFSLESIIGENSIGLPFLETVTYVDDDDIIHLFKNIPRVKPELQIFYEQLFNRNHYKSLWKTKVEYDKLMEKRKKLRQILEKDVILTYEEKITALSDTPKIEDLFLEKAKEGKINLEKNDFMIFKKRFKIVNPSPVTKPIFFYFPEDSTDKLRDYHQVFSPNSTIPITKWEEPSITYFFIKKDRYTESIREDILKVFESL